MATVVMAITVGSMAATAIMESRAAITRMAVPVANMVIAVVKIAATRTMTLASAATVMATARMATGVSTAVVVAMTAMVAAGTRTAAVPTDPLPPVEGPAYCRAFFVSEEISCNYDDKPLRV
ncbi:hypothetical protein Gain_0067_002 [Komagataeibacter intermedius TF2]|nr:hypothetical protein Gain_0067_002 [Komagataeibacter intermedius TF2]